MIAKQIGYLLFFLILSGQTQLSAQDSSSKKVLFVGNSYTFFWNLPQSVACLANSDEITLETCQSTIGGANLGQHWASQKNLKTRSIIENNKFDVVILQDHSMQAINNPDSLLYYGKLFGDLIKEQGAQTYLYMTWSREWDPYMQKKITEEYSRLAKATDAIIVPVGPAWEKARTLRPDIDLYDPDGSHPSTIGAYLTACVFYGVLSGKTPIGIPHRLISTDKDGEKLYLSIQSKENALFLQKVADDMINNWNK